MGEKEAESIQYKHYGGGHAKALEDILKCWLNSGGDHSWQMIVDALKEMKEEKVIESIEKECKVHSYSS